MRGQNNFQFQNPLGGQPAIIAAAAHELKTPLTLISYLAQMLSDENLGLSDTDRLRYVQRLQLVSQRTLRLVQHLTLCYRLEDEAQLAFKFALEPVNMREVCETALHEMSPLAKESDQVLQLAKAARSPIAIVNRDIMYDMVINLVENAIKHNPAGSKVDVRAAVCGQQVRLAVRDDGVAIARGELIRLRQNLGAMPQPLTGHSGTSGLGLYIVQQLASAMGGTLGVGKAGQGTAFFVDVARSRQLSLF